MRPYLRKKFLKLSLFLSACILLLTITDSYHSFASAQIGSYTVSIPIYGQINQRYLIQEAESMASQIIAEQFRQDPSLESLEVTALGERNGEVIPIFSISVSRSQWQESPSVSSWAEYNSASYALLQRHEENAVVASSAISGSATSSDRVRTFASEGEVQRAYDEGRLSGREAQLYSDELD